MPNLDIVTKSYLLEQAVITHRYGSLININPSGLNQALMRQKCKTH